MKNVNDLLLQQCFLSLRDYSCVGGVKIVKLGVELEQKRSAFLTYAVPDRLCDIKLNSLAFFFFVGGNWRRILHTIWPGSV